ncbi:tetratricopeptide repeat protein [Massilia brevitalea]|uniref:tetratricopeptide repeat protein n=1 Tax=Massilia brevitalea TaxID=442526 RepID=UPI002739B07A|nr:tetratricopeptide repeat protein [Massilia brevitalea]
MTRPLLLLLLGACAGAFAQAPVPVALPVAIACDTPVYKADPEALARASQGLDRARADPGPENLNLAAALADLAFATAPQGGPQAQRDANRKAALDMAERAATIWHAASPSATLAQDLQRRARTARNTDHCPLALSLFESALAVVDKIRDANDPLALSVARELMLLASAMSDDPTMNTLAPRLLAALPADQAPLEGTSYAAYLAAADHFYRAEDNERAEALVNELSERVRGAAGDAASAPRLRRLNAERASIYYAQGRYKEAEALAPQRLSGQPRQDALRAELENTQSDMALQVRHGRLKDALAMGEAALARIQAGRASSQAALAEAQAQWEAEKRNGGRDALAAARNRLVQARLDANTWQQALADMQGNTGEVQHALGRSDLALPLYEQALQSYPSTAGSNVYAIERVRGDMALVYRARGDRARALALQQQVHATLLPLLGAQHPDVREAQSEIAALGAPPARPAKRQ